MRHDWERLPDTMEKTVKHGWEPRRRCRNCGKEQSKISQTVWGRVTGYNWEPPAGRCKPKAEQAVNNRPDKLQARLDFNFRDGELVLAGLHIETFGWIIGGSNSGTVTMHAQLDIENAAIIRGKKGQVARVRRLLKEFDYDALRRPFRIGHEDED